MKAILTPGRRRAGLCALSVVLGAGCSSSSPKSTVPGRAGAPSAVAAEDVWGNLLSQLAGDRVAVSSIVHDPGIDPHDYEPKPSDAAAVASARLVVVNGLGYDDWASKLVGANPLAGRVVVDVGRVVGARRGDNPHRWYIPADVHRVIAEMTAALKHLAPSGAAYLDAQADHLGRGLGAYDDAVARIRARYGGTPIGVSESIFNGMAEALGLPVVTPRSFSEAVAEGNEPTPGDKEAVNRQLSDHQVAVFVYNAQNATPDVRAMAATAGKAGIPVVAVTETLSPRGASFQDWQVRQLDELEGALAGPARR